MTRRKGGVSQKQFRKHADAIHGIGDDVLGRTQHGEPHCAGSTAIANNHITFNCGAGTGDVEDNRGSLGITS
ncbi:hypothetical protein [Oxalicibacterium faecigallinarum]|uniref:Uncharacterized protein n=1 Tax=Oxalicibacterium faecigallinarum TaxID=573741 RepID=A0A8J3AM59_9BURK|nr:hypothetical protein [Oxalicibacterium faecigallinarum]GGI16268.1 hypothetical protein GCM10008066_03110 [Oxalicibacterium faecigallinarum]